MRRLLVIGSTNTDMVVKTHRFPQPGETLIGGDFFLFPGGKGANQAVAAVRLQGQVDFICKIGPDAFGRQTLEGLIKEGINIEYVIRDLNTPSGVALIIINAQGENKIVVAPGANAQLAVKDLVSQQLAFEMADLLLIQLEIPLDTVIYAVKQAVALGKQVILNPAPAQPLPDALYQNLFLITPNETEATMLSGIPLRSDLDLVAIAEFFLQKGVQNVVITLGARGAYFQNADARFFVSAPSVEALDTTAAGDVFNGALAVACLEGLPWTQALNMACRAAAISVTRMGAQASAPRRAEIDYEC